MTTISASEIETNNESTAVAIGRAVLAAIDAGPVAVVGADGMDEVETSELRQYLSRRGVSMTYTQSGDFLAEVA